jgi:hypothetical protein
MGMAASKRTCVVCSTSFYGRADARYCSDACRQKTYRRVRNLVRHGSDMRVAIPRSRDEIINRSSLIGLMTHNLPMAGSVPVGDDWMADRFATGTEWTPYHPITNAPSVAEAEAMPVDGEGWSDAKRKRAARERQKAIDLARRVEELPVDTLRHYVEAVAALRRRTLNDDGDVVAQDEPLSDALPDVITREIAAELTQQLYATVPRLAELVTLLRRRAGERRSD